MTTIAERVQQRDDAAIEAHNRQRAADLRHAGGGCIWIFALIPLMAALARFLS